MMRLLALLIALLLPVPSWAAVSYVGSGASTCQTTGASMNCAFPATIAANDLIVGCFAFKKNSSTTIGTPTDAFGGSWVAPSNNIGVSTSGEAYGADGTGDVQTVVFYKVATGTEDGGNAAVGTSGANFNVVQGALYQFTNATGLWTVAALSGGNTTKGTSLSSVATPDPTLVANDIVFHCGSRSINAANASSEALSQSGATFGAASEKSDNGSALGLDVGIIVSTHPVTTPGTGDITVTWTSGTSTNASASLLRVSEASAAAATTPSSLGFMGTIIK
jgi:hypothetical protein